MSEIFELAMLPASEGDCLVLTYGSRDDHRSVIVDLGRTSNYKANKPELTALGHVEAFVISHIDADHIEGAMPMVKEAQAPFASRDVWFNAYHHLVEARDATHEDYETFSAKQGEKLSLGIRNFAWTWNALSGGKPITIETVPEPVALEGGLTITILSPDNNKLAQLEPKWAAELKSAGLRPFDPDESEQEPDDGIEHFGSIDVEQLAATAFSPDGAEPNGSSIAFVAEYGGKRVMLLADAHSDIVERQVAQLAAAEPAGRFRVDLLKVSHHGSAGNTSPALLDLIDCTRFAFSTDGTRRGHPDPETIARILVRQPERKKSLYFNFRQDSTLVWDRASLKTKWNFEARYPAANDEGRLVIKI